MPFQDFLVRMNFNEQPRDLVISANTKNDGHKSCKEDDYPSATMQKSTTVEEELQAVRESKLIRWQCAYLANGPSISVQIADNKAADQRNDSELANMMSSRMSFAHQPRLWGPNATASSNEHFNTPQRFNQEVVMDTDNSRPEQEQQEPRPSQVYTSVHYVQPTGSAVEYRPYIPQGWVGNEWRAYQSLGPEQDLKQFSDISGSTAMSIDTETPTQSGQAGFWNDQQPQNPQR